MDVKHQKKQWLRRIPVMISSKTPIGAHVSGAERLALAFFIISFLLVFVQSGITNVTIAWDAQLAENNLLTSNNVTLQP